MTESERWELEQNVLRFTVARNIDELNHEINQLEQLIQVATEAEQNQPERKLRELEGVLRELNIRQTGEKLLIFTEAKDTLDYLVENLTAWNFTTVTIHGGMKPEDRVEAERIFRSEDVQVMIATEAAGEGINLQFCHLMVNYDIPWNPTRLEQRLGRIHRYGQEYEVYMYNLVAGNTREGRVLEAVLLKLERMRVEMGNDRVFDVIGERLSNAQLEGLIRDAVTNRRMFDEILASIDSAWTQNGADIIDSASLSNLATRYVNVEGMVERQQQARENRLSPSFIRNFFLAAFETHFPSRVDQRADGNWRIRHVPADLRNVPPHLAAAYGQPSDQYRTFTFDIDESRRTGVEFVGPGHPLFEAVSHYTFGKFQDDLARGAVFYDPDGEREGLIWLIEGTINDGLGAIVGQQLFAVYQPVDGTTMETLHPSMFLDFEAPDVPPSISSAIAGMVHDQGQIVGWSISQQLAPYRDEIEARRRDEISIIHRYLQESFDVLIARSEGMLMDYEHKQSAGKDMRMKIAEEERRNSDLRQRKESRLRRADQEAMIMLGEPRIIGVAAILSKVADAESRAGTPMRRDDAVERAAMDYVMAYEREQGRLPEDLAAQKLPYDIRSTDEEGNIRYIEVKGRASVGGVELSEREWLTAENLGMDYWLYIVSNAMTQPELKIVRDPARKLSTADIIKRTRYHIPTEVWQIVTEDNL